MEKISARSVESVANYEGNDALLLFERVKDPVIYEQILDLLCKGEESKKGEMMALIENGRLKIDEQGELVEIPYIPRPKEEVKRDLDEAIAREEGSTEFETSDYPYEQSTSSAIKLHAISPWSEKPYTEKQMSIIEAHEKGHNIRPYNAPFHTEHFRDGFKFDPVKITEAEVRMFRKVLSEEENKESDESVRDICVHYMSGAMEIAERMSQLKNYFGMKGADEFTKEHLEYARARYIEDTGMDNGMSIFFRAITPDTESEFLWLINNSGI